MKSESVNQNYFDSIYQLKSIIIDIKKIMNFSIVTIYINWGKFISLCIFVKIDKKLF